MTPSALIDDFASPQQASNGQQWRFSSDRVMGGVSRGHVAHVLIEDRQAMQLSGEVSLANNGGFVQMSLDFADAGAAFDGSSFTGLRVTLLGDGGAYALSLRTADLSRPWQSYRSALIAGRSWQTHDLPFRSFKAHRTDHPLNPACLRRVGLIAIGEARRVEVAISDLRFY